jgi:CelD/BcsL family acetyltransferase involved in cellulose biosynthesis
LLNSGLPETDEFSRDLASRAAAGEVRGYLLMKAGRAAAYVLCYCRGGIATYDFVGFDPDLGELSPGAVLQYLLLESLFDDPDIAVFDFTEGEGSQKQLFATDNRLCAKTYVLRASLYNEASIRAHRALDRIVGRVGSMLDAVGMKSALRKFLRRSA